MAYTPEQIQAFKQQILQELGTGISMHKAVVAVGITERTVYMWRRSDGLFDEAVKVAHMKRPDRAPCRGPVARGVKAVEQSDVEGVIEEICRAIRAGLPIDYACLLANVQRSALRKWMQDDENLAAQVNKAQAQNLLWWISRIRQGAERDWRAALAYLERIFPALFAEVKQVEISQKETHTESPIIDVTPEATIERLTRMTDEELQSIIGRGTV
jgi:hypothetical protein